MIFYILFYNWPMRKWLGYLMHVFYPIRFSITLSITKAMEKTGLNKLKLLLSLNENNDDFMRNKLNVA